MAKDLNTDSKEQGFTLIELLVVILIIGVLAAIAVPMFLNQREAAIQAERQSDLKQIRESISMAQMKSGKSLYQITTIALSANECFGDTDPLTLPKTHNCWNMYNKTLADISAVSKIDITNLVDPYERPYYINPNELELSPTDCRNDKLGYLAEPYARMNFVVTDLPKMSAACT